eukprot:gb/GECH01002323.1/.p1 GENE.gb/GECH01002323.1/~~gb/GECH01002323.1/.p1  ORF type:complete len:419 (+),score=79.79 gb/GECH01002323.1/:1-1257(+)
MSYFHQNKETLQSRLPYRPEDRSGDKTRVFAGYSQQSIERNTKALSDDAFSSSERRKALLLILEMTTDPKGIVKVLSSNALPGINYLLKSVDDSRIHELSCNIINRIVTLPQGIEECSRKKTFEAVLSLLNSVKNEKESDQNSCKATAAACQALDTASHSYEGKERLVLEPDSMKTLILASQSPFESFEIFRFSISALANMCEHQEGRAMGIEQVDGMKNALIHVFSKIQGISKNLNKWNSEEVRSTVKEWIHLCSVLTFGFEGKRLFYPMLTHVIKLLEMIIFHQKEIEEPLILLNTTMLLCRILVFEDAKQLASKQVASVVESDQNSNIDLPLLLIKTLRMGKSNDQNKSDTIKYLIQYSIRALQLLSEYPSARESIYMAIRNEEKIMKDVFSNTDLFYPFGSSDPDLHPNNHSFN